MNLIASKTSPMKRGLKRELAAAVEHHWIHASKTSPMKRGLKHRNLRRARNGNGSASKTSPMKRGLKLCGSPLVIPGSAFASKTSPMKRGLKHGAFLVLLGNLQCFKNLPDEEGTETRNTIIKQKTDLAASKT